METWFHENHETRTFFLDAELQNFIQGDLSITDHNRRFKQMADSLRELDEPVTNKTQVLNILCCLNERYTTLGLHLRHGRPFPSFLASTSS